MSKAKYTTENVGHYGLGFDHYCHFTSPIRRYPDVMAHRLLQHYLDGGESASKDRYEEGCKHSSERERLASDAERASIKYKQVEFMSTMDKDVIFDGIITGVTEFGIFVEITETASEGLVRMNDLGDDYYEHDKDNYRLIGQRTKKIYTFGDAVKVQVKDTNLARRSMDLYLAGNTTSSIRSRNGGGFDEKSGRSSRGSSSRDSGRERKSSDRKKKPASSEPKPKRRRR